MDVTPVISNKLYNITAYGGGGFTLKDKKFFGNLLVKPKSFCKWNNSKNILDLVDSNMSFFSDVEILLIGLGEFHEYVSKKALSELSERFNISIETMTTGAACRTYNVLLAEGRSVSAALIAV